LRAVFVVTARRGRRARYEDGMLTVYVPRGNTLERQVVDTETSLPEQAVWIDLVRPTQIEDKLVEQLTGVAVPTREEMQEIEISSRLYVENGGRFMTATLMCQADSDTPHLTAVTFILAGNRLVTVRYDEPRPFVLVSNKLARICPPNVSGQSVFMDLLDAVIDRTADILERIGVEVDQVSQQIFQTEAAHGAPFYNSVRQTIGHKGDLTSKVRESLVSIGRVVIFLANEAPGMGWTKEGGAQLRSMQRDVQSLSDHATYLTNNITFQLDAMLGVVTIEQNNVIKIFSVMAVVLLPPTLIASIYGMNFHHMPELGWNFGYPIALGLMGLSGILPYVYFKWRKWL
jgi:magnesium transporter